MKKLFSLLLIIVSLIYGCDSKQINNGNGDGNGNGTGNGNDIDKEKVPNLYVSATATSVDAWGEFTIYSDIAATQPIAIGVTSIDNQVVTITDPYVILEQGAKEVKGKFKGISEGKTMILITSQNANIGTGSVEVTVGKMLPKLSITAEKIDVDDLGTFTISSDVPLEEPITISITSSDNKIISVITPTRTIPQGEKIVSGTFQGLKKGIANLIISANNVNLVKDKHEVNVGDVAINQNVALSINADQLTTIIHQENYFTIQSDKNVSARINVTVTSSNEKVLKIIDNTVVINKGSSYVTGKYKAVGGGKAKISITTSTEGVLISKKEVSIAVEYPILSTCNEDNPFTDEWFANETSHGFILWFNKSYLKYFFVNLENLGADYYGQDLGLTPVEPGTNISTLSLTRNPEHALVGTNTVTQYYILPTFTQEGTYYVVFNVADGVSRDDPPSELTYEKVAQKAAWALVTVTMTDNKATQVVLRDFKCPATVVGE